MSDDPIQRAAPLQRGFEYEVRLAVSIPTAWATLLKEASKHHYDLRCNESGHHGTVNGLYNTACDSEWPSNVADLPAPRSRVLFHHSWERALGGLARFALMHPLMGEEGKKQIEWSLRTQSEIITEPVIDLEPARVIDLDAAALEALERRLSPPWVIAEEGIRR